MPDVEPLVSLAMTGATTVVAAMATSAWESARARTAALFHRRGDSRQDVEAQLERSAARITSAGEAAAVREGEIARWQADLVDLLRELPDTEDGLLALIRELQQQLPPVRQQWVQHVTARDGGSAYGALGPGSSVHVHHHTGPAPTDEPL
ncbi:hypothetical protein [Kitasatospora sp. HPMI-4]|uniref:hypothetical protein n=1 Tax=Kitasatospora sp. HPMI-4 TaxID=3448443 RepID=UPI003F1AA16D